MVGPADAGADAGDVGAVDVQQDRCAVGRVVDPVEVAGRDESGDRPLQIGVVAHPHEVLPRRAGEELFVLDTLDDRADTSVASR